MGNAALIFSGVPYTYMNQCVSAETEGMVTSVVAFSDEEKMYFAK